MDPSVWLHQQPQLAEQASVMDLSNLVPHNPVRGGGSPQTPPERLGKFTEKREGDDQESGGEDVEGVSAAPNPHPSHHLMKSHRHPHPNWGERCETQLGEGTEEEDWDDIEDEESQGITQCSPLKVRAVMQMKVPP